MMIDLERTKEQFVKNISAISSLSELGYLVVNCETVRMMAFDSEGIKLLDLHHR